MIGSEFLRLELGISHRLLDHYVRRGYLQPAPETARGSGTPRLFTNTEASIARLMVELRNVGFRVPVAAELARRSVEDHWGGSLTIVESNLRTTGLFEEKDERRTGNQSAGGASIDIARSNDGRMDAQDCTTG